MKHIGILAYSAEGAALCFLAACHEGFARLGPHLHPDITLSISAMGTTLDAWARHDYPVVRTALAATAARLAAAGCEFFVCPDNTAHIALEIEEAPLSLPGLHIAEVAVRTATVRGYRRLGLLGTGWTMEGPVYGRACQRHGVELRVPPATERQRVNDIIFAELCLGEFRDDSRREYVRIIERLRAEGCDAVILGCTEIPLLITPEVSPLPTLDSTRLLAQRAVAVALASEPVPRWRGGPFD